MTVIDKITFLFNMADEQFARELYAEWDGFCRRCVMEVLEEYFSRYDNKDTYIEIDRLELDMGGIQQEDFYDEFPVRLRAALERNFTPESRENGPLQAISPETSGRNEPTAYALEKRLENLLHYLEYGFCLPEWYGQDFNLLEELLHFKEKEETEKFLSLLSARPHVLDRLYLQMDGDRLAEVLPFSAWLSSPILGQHEKQRYLAMALERAPQAIIRFIHETRETGSVEDMAELLESPHVRRIMEAETESHAEIDLPEYWHRLYGWLLEYYPFNGVPMFGDKQHFRLHLNSRLLSFIRKRVHPAYLSKAELTMQFLLEVFGTDYYLTVLDIIYHNQRLNEDGSPASGDSYVWELYYMLLQLSLLKTDTGKANRAGGAPVPGVQGRETGEAMPDSKIRMSGTEKGEIAPESWNEEDRKLSDSALHDVSSRTSAPLEALTKHTGSFEEWLENKGLPDTVKKRLVQRLVQENPEMLIQWVKGRPDKRSLLTLVSLIGKSDILLLAGQVSLQLMEVVSTVMEVVSAMMDVMGGASSSVSWLKGIRDDKLAEALTTVVLEGTGLGIFSPSDASSMQVVQIAELLYKEITGAEVAAITASSDAVSYTAIPSPLQEFVSVVARKAPSLKPADNRTHDVPLSKYLPDSKASDTEWLAPLRIILSDDRIPDEGKRRLVLQWFDSCHGEEDRFVQALLSERLLAKVIGLLGERTLEHIVMRLADAAFFPGSGRNGSFTIRRLIGLFIENTGSVAGFLSRPVGEIWLPLFSWLASHNGKSEDDAVTESVETVVQMISCMTGSSDIMPAINRLIGQIARISPLYTMEAGNESSDETAFVFGPEDSTALALLLRVQEYIRRGKAKEISGLPAGKRVVSEIEPGTERLLETNTATEGYAKKREDDIAVAKIESGAENVNTEYGRLENRQQSLENGQSGMELSAMSAKDSNELQTLFEGYLNDTAGFWEWLRKETFSPIQKREVFRSYATTHPEEAMRLMRETVVSEEDTIHLWGEIIGKDMFLNVVRHTDEALSHTLEQIIKAIETIPTGRNLFPGGNAEREVSLTKALILLFAEGRDWRSMDAEEITSLFLAHWHYVLSGEKEYTDAERKIWMETGQLAAGTVTSAARKVDGNIETVTGNGMPPLLSDLSLWLLSSAASDTAKSQLLRHYARWQPKLLWKLLRSSKAEDATHNSIPIKLWQKWLGTEDWLEMVSGVSLSSGETLRRTIGYISEKYNRTESVLSDGLVRFIAGCPMERAYYGDAPAVIQKYVSGLEPVAGEACVPTFPKGQTTTADGQPKKQEEEDVSMEQPFDTDSMGMGVKNGPEALVEEIKSALHITDAVQHMEEAVQPECIGITNAGLCLLALWLPRLFDILGLLTEDRKDLKDTEARIRAIFILQRLVTDEKREYREQELAFNRILTGCPFHVPLPKALELTGSEMQTIESMLAGVKANWNKLRNTSVKGFQHSFIERPGRMERREDKWVLYVEERAYDILLDSLPWSYRQIRLPWLKKKLNVLWRDKEDFDFENYND